MKKALWVVFVCAVAVPLFAQEKDSYDEYHDMSQTTVTLTKVEHKVARTVVQQQGRPATVQSVQRQLQVALKDLNMRDILRLADTFLEYASQKGRTEAFIAKPEADVLSVVGEINNSKDENGKPVIASRIEEFLKYEYHEWHDEDAVKEIEVFLNVLKQYPAMNEQERKAYQQMKAQLAEFRADMRKSTQDDPVMTMQSLVCLADTYFSLYSTEPNTKIIYSFRAVNPVLAAYVAREIDQEIETGWGTTFKLSDYIDSHLSEADQKWKSPEPVTELDVFAGVLKAANY